MSERGLPLPFLVLLPELTVVAKSDGDHVVILAESSLWQNDEAAAY